MLKERLVSLACIVIALTTFGCSEDDPAEVHLEGVQVTIDLESAAVTSGESFGVTIIARNHGPRVAQITFSSGCTFAYRFVSASGDMLDVPQFCPGIGSKLTLKAGEAYRESFQVSTRKPANADWPISGDRLPPGKYRFQAGLIENEGFYPWPEQALEVR